MLRVLKIRIITKAGFLPIDGNPVCQYIFVVMKYLLFFLPVLILAACQFTQGGSGDTSLIVINARIWTGDDARPWAEALAIQEDTLLAVGTTTDIQALAGPDTRVIDAKGQLLVPGFNDSHLHFVDAGFNLTSVQLRDAGTPAEFIRRIAEFVAKQPEGTWILGGDWDHTLWGSILPDASWIDSVSTRHPILIQRLDGHMGLANSAAMRTAGITATTKDIPGGTIVRDSTGRPTGIFKDNAMNLIFSAVDTPSHMAQDKALGAAMAYVAALGVTSVQHMGTWDDLATFRRAHAAGTLKTRICAAVPLDTWKRLKDTVEAVGRGDRWLRIGGLKGYADGSLGSHTAAMLAPYTDQPKDRGLDVTSIADLYNWTTDADRAGLQVMIHAIGDRANRNVLDVYERIAKENGPRDRRFRIEHAQHIHPDDIPRFGVLGVIPSMQPYHCIDDGRWAEPLIGPQRCRTTYAFRQLIDTKAKPAFGSDWYVAPPSPLEGIYAAVTRRTLDDKNPGGWYPEQKITVEEALRAYTVNAAYATFEENLKGRLRRGMLADFVILSQDIFRISPEKIRDAEITLTVVGGEVVYEKN